jgi:signal recognition particle receptor subunit beta
MATINFATREITAKVVYFGAPGAGCNTNVERLHAQVPGRSKSALHKFGPPDVEEWSEYFDYVSTEPAPLESFSMSYRIYSLPGDISLPAHREELVRNVDAVVLVADARGPRNRANVDALLELESLLKTLGLEMSSLVVVIQVNQMDADDARPLADVVFDLNPFGFSVVPAVARAGEGVIETHQEVAAGIALRVRNGIVGLTPALPVTAIHVPERETDAEVIGRLVDAIREASAVVTIEQVSEDSHPQGQSYASEDVEPGPEVEVAFQPRELVGSHPVRVLQADVLGDRVRVDVLMERMGGGEPRRITVWLLNRPTDTPPVPRSPPGPPKDPTPVDRVFDYLPDDQDFTESSGDWDAQENDLPAVWYGVFGVSSGILIGLLSGYLVGIL